MHKNCNLLVMRENSEDALWMPMRRWINNGSLLQEQCRAARRHCFESAGSLNGSCHRPSLSVSCEWEAVLIWGGNTLIISNKATIPKALSTTLADSLWLSSSHSTHFKPWLNGLSVGTSFCYVRNSLMLVFSACRVQPRSLLLSTGGIPNTVHMLLHQIQAVLIITCTENAKAIQTVTQSGSSAMFPNRYEVSEKEIKVCDLPRMQQELCQFCSATVPPGDEQRPIAFWLLPSFRFFFLVEYQIVSPLKASKKTLKSNNLRMENYSVHSPQFVPL